jgi:hypothetical protein
MYALIVNNAVTQVGELSILFPNTSNPNHAFAIEQGALEIVEGEQKTNASIGWLLTVTKSMVLWSLAPTQTLQRLWKM